MMKFRLRILAFVAVGAGSVLAAPGPLSAQSDTSPWESTPYSKARIISAGPAAGDGKSWQIGLQIKLDPGWKTYWRVPGDAGLPPRFDWAKSENVDAVSLEWPVPGRYVDEYATTIGYKDEVVFPIVVTPKNPSAPTRATVDLDYAVCKDICLPAQATLTLDLAPDAGRSTVHSTLIEAFRKRVPRRAAGDDTGRASVSLLGEGEKTKLVVDVKSRNGVKPEVFVEGPDEFYFSDPKPDGSNGGTANGDTYRMTVAVDGVTAETPLTGKRITLTVVDGDTLTEHEFPIN